MRAGVCVSEIQISIMHVCVLMYTCVCMYMRAQSDLPFLGHV